MIVTVRKERIERNLKNMRLATGKPLILMCKANGYGHGMLEVARAEAAAYGVATEEEGARLRAVVSKDILVSAPRLSALDLIAKNDLVPIIGEETYLKAAVFSGKVRRCHLKADSGMHRMGFRSPKDCLDAALFLSEHGVRLEGIATHYKESGENEKKQNAAFDACLSAIKGAFSARGLPLPITHVTASGRADAQKYDMLRVGLAAYGYGDLDALAPAMEVSSEILCVKRLAAGDTLGYGSGFRAKKALTAYTVLGGYADGIDRREVGREVLCKGARCRIAAVCMDTFEVVTERVDLCVGDRVIIMSEELDAAYVAACRGSIPYEVLVGYDTPRAEMHYE